MPIYEYQCSKCHRVFEEWHKHIDEDIRHPCPECQGDAERIVSNTSFVLKGGGWYVTDYGNRKNDPAPGKESTPPSASAKGSAPGKESAPPPVPARESAPAPASSCGASG